MRQRSYYARDARTEAALRKILFDEPNTTTPTSDHLGMFPYQPTLERNQMKSAPPDDSLAAVKTITPHQITEPRTQRPVLHRPQSQEPAVKQMTEPMTSPSGALPGNVSAHQASIDAIRARDRQHAIGKLPNE